MRQADREPARRLDRERLAARRNGAGICDDARRRREHERALVGADGDAAPLARVVRMRAVERERLEDRTVHRPGPRPRHGHEQEQQESEEHTSPHRRPPPLLSEV